MKKRFAILGPYGGGNIGDAAIVDAMIQNIRKHCPDSEVYGININPEDTQVRHNIPSFPIHRNFKSGSPKDNIDSIGQKDVGNTIRQAIKKIPIIYVVLNPINVLYRSIRSIFQEFYFIFRSYRSIKGFDLLIVNGSGQLCDTWGGPWWHPYGLFRWAIIARVAGVKYVVLSVGAGPINSALSRSFVKYALKLAYYRSFRNERSKDLIESIGVLGENLVVPDIAFSLPVVLKKDASPPRNGSPVIGINPMAYYDPRYWHKKNENIYINYINKMTILASWLMSRSYTVILFSSALMDRNAIEDVKKSVLSIGGKFQENQLLVPNIDSVEDLMSNISLMDYVIASRLHSLVLSLLMHKPIFAISPHHKVDSLTDNLGLREYSIDINTIDIESFKHKFISFENMRDHIAISIKSKVYQYKERLERQYSDLF
jgi:polysaccharide pyruvyl transferase WcaK-like protein